jgi:uncharacterized protein YjcR
LFFLAHELKTSIATVLNFSVVEIQAWSEWFQWKAEKEKADMEKARSRRR